MFGEEIHGTKFGEKFCVGGKRKVQNYSLQTDCR